MDKETADKTRGMIRRATIKNIKDDGQVQTCSVEVADGVWRDDVEIHQPYGFASHVPPDGALAVVLSAGGDEGDLIVLPISNPSSRLGRLGEGDVGQYNRHGDRIVLTDAGDIEVASGRSINIKVGGVSFSITADGIDATGGYFRHNGKNIGSTHTNGGVVHGAESTEIPNN